MRSPGVSTQLPWTHLKSTRNQHRQHDKIVWLIGGVKIFYGLLLLGVGVGAFNLVGKNLATELWRLTERWNIDFHNHYIQMLYRQANEMDGNKLIFFTAITFGYAALFFVEGIGLILGKYWAQWVVIIDTASFIPSEIYYLVRQFSWFNTFLLIVNIAVVLYLVWRIMTRNRSPNLPATRRHKRKSHAAS
jgi:uncharacterized membrane protein (DUF2068 family)